MIENKKDFPGAAIDTQISELGASILNRSDRLESGISHNNAEIEKMKSNGYGRFWFGVIIGITIVFAVVGFFAVTGRPF